MKLQDIALPQILGHRTTAGKMVMQRRFDEACSQLNVAYVWLDRKVKTKLQEMEKDKPMSYYEKLYDTNLKLLDQAIEEFKQIDFGEPQFKSEKKRREFEQFVHTFPLFSQAVNDHLVGEESAAAAVIKEHLEDIVTPEQLKRIRKNRLQIGTTRRKTTRKKRQKDAR
jgi:hypothetical protein